MNYAEHDHDAGASAHQTHITSDWCKNYLRLQLSRLVREITVITGYPWHYDIHIRTAYSYIKVCYARFRVIAPHPAGQQRLLPRIECGTLGTFADGIVNPVCRRHRQSSVLAVSVVYEQETHQDYSSDSKCCKKNRSLIYCT
jgi:hypothetical protein